MVQLAHIVLALAIAGGAYFLFFRTKSDSTSPSPAAAAFVNGAGAKGANGASGEAVDTGRDFVASLNLSVSLRDERCRLPFISRTTTGASWVRSPTRACAGGLASEARVLQE